MNKEIEDIELLENYLKGTLDLVEKINTEQRLKSEPGLAAAFNELQLIQQTLRLNALNEKLDLLRTLEKGEQKYSSIPSDKPNKSYLKYGLLLFVLIFTGVSAWLLYRKSVDNQQNKQVFVLSDEKFYSYILHTTKRSTAEVENRLKEDAYNLFTIKEFELAIPKLKTLWSEHNDTLAYFYLGIAELSVGNTELAKSIFSDNALGSYPIQELIPLCDPY